MATERYTLEDPGRCVADGGPGRRGRRMAKITPALRLAAQLDEAVRLIERAYVAGGMSAKLTSDMLLFLARHQNMCRPVRRKP